MAIDSLKTRLLSKRKLKATSFQIVYKSIWNHPFLVFMLLLLTCLQLYFPLLFSVMVSASPVIVCTAVLLATLLIHGQSNDNPHRVNYTCKLATPETTHTSCVDQKEGYYKDRFAEVRKDIVEKGMKAYFAEFQAKNNDKMARSRVHNEGFKHVDHEGSTDNGSTDIESDEADGSVLDGLVTEAMSTPQETRPLLDSQDHNQPHNNSSSHNVSHNVSPKSDEDEGVGSEDVDYDEEEEEEEEREENGFDGIEKRGGTPVTMWTEEDEKNLRYLGTCELERNQYLENLIAKRRHQRNFSLISERNLMDLNRRNSDLPTFQVTPIATTNHKVVNPFDVPNNDPNNPGSAPSIIPLPRKNPFDSPCTSPKEGTQKVNPFEVLNNQEFARKEFAFRRYESFTTGYSFVGDGSGSGSGSGSRQGFMPIDKREGFLLPRPESFNTRSTLPNLFSLDKPTDSFHMKPVFVPEQVQNVNSMEDKQSTTNHDDSVSTSCGSSDTELSVVASTNSKHHHQDDEEVINTNTNYHSLQNGHDNDTCHEKDEKDHASSSSSTTPKADDKHAKTSQVEGHEVREHNNSLPKNSLEKSNINHTSNDDDHSNHIEPVYDTSPSCVDKEKSFSSTAEM